MYNENPMSASRKVIEAALLDHQPVSKDGWTAVRTSWLEKVKSLALAAYNTSGMAVRKTPTDEDIEEAAKVMAAVLLARGAVLQTWTDLPQYERIDLLAMATAVLKMPKHRSV
jgi:hypothetical protein